MDDNQQNNQNNNNQDNKNQGIDYQKIADIVENNLKGKESAILKSYFKQQGLEQDELEESVKQYKDFKKQQEASKPSVESLSSEVSKLKEELNKKNSEIKTRDIKMSASGLADELGVEVKNIEYILKLADTSKVYGEDEKLSLDELKKALKEVVDKVPNFKKQTQTNQGFQFGGYKPKEEPKGKIKSEKDFFNEIFK